VSWRLERTAWIHWKVDNVHSTGGAPRRVSLESARGYGGGGRLSRGPSIGLGAGGLAEQTKTSSGCVDRWVPTVGEVPLGHLRTHAPQRVAVSVAPSAG